MRSPFTARPPSLRIGASAFARCWVEQMRPVAPLRMMPMVLVVMRSVILGSSERNHAPPHRLPHLRFRHPVRLHRARHDDADAAVARRIRRPRGIRPYPAIPEGARHQGDLLHAGLHHRKLARRKRRGGRGRPRDRPSLLGAHPERQPDPRRGGGRPHPRQREYPEAHRPDGARLPLAVLGPQPAHHRPADQARLPLRFEPDGRRLHSRIGRGAATRPSSASPTGSARRRR